MEVAREDRSGRRARRRALLVVACAGLLGIPAQAAGHEARGHAQGHPAAVSAKVKSVVGAGAIAAADGLYRVAPTVGEPMLTHGPDARATLETRATGLASDGTGFVAGAVERPPVCATDFYQRAVYVNLAGTPNRLGEVTPFIRTVIGRMNAVLNSESLASGGPGADYKFLCDGSGQARVDVVSAPGGSFEEVVAAARSAGLASDRASLLLFVDGRLGGSCGIASYEQDASLSIDNRSNVGGGFALVYEPCWEGETAMHESAHTMGAVQPPAPNSTGNGGHCNEGADVLCYSPDGGDRNQGATIENCPGALRFDCNFDDYFDSAPEAGEYLASHWNLGSPLNRFIRRQDADTAAAAPVPRAKLGHKRGASGERGDWRHFEVNVQRGAKSLRVRMFADPGADLALFVRQRGEPTRNRFACRSSLRARHATCRISDPGPGRWYVAVRTLGGAVGVGFKISARAR